GRVRQRKNGAVAQGHAQPVPTWPAFEAELADVRARGLSRSEGEIVPGISAMAAPVFEPAGAMVLALVAIGPAATFDSRWTGAVARALQGCAREVAQRLGSV
ncbi:MAG: IclR family transcriptional regulator, partial [Comamonadaceae bacterium]